MNLVLICLSVIISEVPHLKYEFGPFLSLLLWSASLCHLLTFYLTC